MTDAAIVARGRKAFIDFAFAVTTFIAGLTIARVVCNEIDTGRVVLARCRQAFVNISRTIVRFVAGRTCASVAVRNVSTDSTVFTVLKG